MNASPTSVPPRNTLFGLQGHQHTTVGAVLLVVGLALFVGSVLPVFLAFGSFQSDPFGSFGAIAGVMMLSFFLGVLGIVLLGIGGFMLRLGLIRPVASYVAGEASPAITTAATALGAGLRQGMGSVAAATAPVATTVKVKCRNCGYLDSEDATYCSKCGQPL